MDWCMIKAGVRYTRIPDPAHVLSARGGQGGRNKILIITGGEALLKMSVRVLLAFFFYVPIRWDPVLKNSIKGSFIHHSFIHFFPIPDPGVKKATPQAPLPFMGETCTVFVEVTTAFFDNFRRHIILYL